MEFFEPAPPVRVETAEYTRLLGFPRGHVLDGRALELAEWARCWYADHGRPWVYVRESHELEIEPDAIRVDGVRFHSDRLRQTLDRAGAHSVVLVAVSAGPEIEQQAHRAWLEEKPDEYFFLEMFGSAVVEHLTTMSGARLCSWADGEAMAVLPHYSPGYPEWDIVEQEALFGLLAGGIRPGGLEVLESGMLRPKKSLLGVFGITRHTDRVSRLSGLVPCENCSFAPCQFRRAPYKRAAFGRSGIEHATTVGPAPVYGLSTKALKRWAAERLSLDMNGDGQIRALFRYEGTTCSNMGRPLVFYYRVTLGPREDGFPIREQVCTPAPEDDGHRAMCEYLRDGDRLIDTISKEQPLIGQPLDAVLSWKRPSIGPGCYCEPEARQHKWGLVLETIHYAISHDQITGEP
jgi:hypothetical protein